jgi:hypothetical protein
MATRRTTSDKRQRERAKQAKAAAKRERRQDRSSDARLDDAGTGSADDDDLTTEQLLARIEELHADYDAGTVSFEEFDEQKSELVDRIALRLAQ